MTPIAHLLAQINKTSKISQVKTYSDPFSRFDVSSMMSGLQRKDQKILGS